MSVGSDSKIFIYDGKTGDTVSEVDDSPHTGSIVSFPFFLLFMCILRSYLYLVDGCIVESR